MESSQTQKLNFLSLDGASEAERAFLERILAPGHSKVELPIDSRLTAQTETPPEDQLAGKAVYETCRLPPDGTEYAADEPPPSAAESPPPPPPPPANQTALAGEVPVSSPPAAPQHLMSQMMPGMFPQPPAGFPFPNMFPMPGGGVNMMYGLPTGYPGMAPYPGPETAVSDGSDRRRGAGKKGSDKPLSALAPPYQAYPLTPRTATGPPLMIQPYGNPYGTQYYQLPYPYYHGAAYPGAEMMPVPMPMPPQQLDVTVPPPALTEEARTPLCEPYGRAYEAQGEVSGAGSVTSAGSSDSATGSADDDTPETPPSAASPVSDQSPGETATPADTTPAPETPDTAAAAGPVRLSFGFDLDDKLPAGESGAVQLEHTGGTTRTQPEERAGDGRSSSAEPGEPAPTSYVATVTVSQRRVIPLEPEPEPELAESPAGGSERGLASPREMEAEREAVSPDCEPAGEPETAANGVTSPEPALEPKPGPEPAQEQDDRKEQEQEPAAPAPAAAPPAPRSWASLFSKKTEEAPAVPVVAVAPKPAPAPSVPEADSEVLALGEALARFELCHKNVYLQPRGLTNKSNWCYINAVLQALASCTPFYHLMKSLPHNVGVMPDQSRTPIIDAMVEFVREFSPLPELPRVPRRERGQLRDIQHGAPLEPSYVYAMLSRVSSDAFRVAGRQEDAEEFLTCLLSGLQDEMAEVLKAYQRSKEEGRPPLNGATNGDAGHHSEDEEGDSDDWQTIIGKNRGQVTRSAELQNTPISRVFSGQLRSSLHRQGAKATATVQSFFSLQLDIQSPQVSSVEQALESLVERDPVVGLTCPQSGQPIDAYQQAALELTPPTLILHLKRFLYDPATDGVQKLLKRVTFPVDLELRKELLSNVRTKMPPGQKRYRLFAVVYHSGKESTKGHYITDAYHPAYQQWVRYDDSSVTAVAEATVLRPEPPLVPYILFYRRLDTVAAHSHGK